MGWSTVWAGRTQAGKRSRSSSTGEANESLLKQRIWFGWGDVHVWQIDAASWRPWGLATLVTGAYGVVGFCIWGSITLVPWGIAAVRSKNRSVWPEGWPGDMAIRSFTVILLVHAIDAALNSGYWLPIVFCVGMVNTQLGRSIHAE